MIKVNLDKFDKCQAMFNSLNVFFSEAMCELTICKLSDCSSPVSGGKEIILLCDKVTKGNLRYSSSLLHSFTEYF